MRAVFSFIEYSTRISFQQSIGYFVEKVVERKCAAHIDVADLFLGKRGLGERGFWNIVVL